ncbi:MAG: carbohydrate ABC transporter permease [Ilumatobacter sp.]|uniref:carbohydrate ABC transporter permease n=1 Tax=Ilumatobacter sp. TaxID=1967498 RepID=UPI00391B16EA
MSAVTNPASESTPRPTPKPDSMLTSDLTSKRKSKRKSTPDSTAWKTPKRNAWDDPRGWRRIGRYALLIGVSIVVLFPVYTTVIAAFKPSNRLFDNPLLPDGFTLDLIREAWTSGRLGTYLWNSLLVATIVTFAQVATSLLSGYAFAYLRFPGRKLVFLAFLATLLVPLEATVVVNFDTMQSLGDGVTLPILGWTLPTWLGGLNTLQGLTVPFLATAFGTFLMRQALLSLPSDLRDAARIDGIGHLGFIRHVGIPLVRPTLAALALFSFLSTWNQYLWPSLVISDQDRHTVQSGLRLLSKSNLDAPNLVMAGTIIAAVPILIVLVVFQRQLVRGLTAGAVKG